MWLHSPPPFLAHKVLSVHGTRTSVLRHIVPYLSYVWGITLNMSHRPKDECTMCFRRHKRPYNSKCRYLKAAVDKCVELRLATTEYRHYLLDLQPAWENSDNDDMEDKSHEVSEDMKSLVQMNQGYQDQIKQAKKDISSLVDQMMQLTMVVNTLTTGHLSGAQHTPAVPPIQPTQLGSTPSTTTMNSQSAGPATYPSWSLPPPGLGATRGVPTQPPQVGPGVPAGLGVAKPIWSTTQSAGLPNNPPMVPPHNPSAGNMGWAGWGSLQSTPGQVGVPIVPPTLLPNSLLHQDWFETKTSDSKGKRSKHWMRPDFYIPSEKRYDEVTYRELMFGMVSVAECMARYNLPNYPVLNYLEHMKFVSMKGMTASFNSEALAKYEYLVTSKVLAGLLPVHVPADHEAVYTHLSAENVILKSHLNTPIKKGNKAPWFRCPRDVCLKLDQEKCDKSDCDRKHVCATCRGDHVVKKCSDSSKKA